MRARKQVRALRLRCTVAVLVLIAAAGCRNPYGADSEDRLWISATAVHLSVGDTARLGVTMERNGQLQERPQISAPSPLPDDLTVEFWSSIPEVVEVSTAGLVSARSAGTAVVWVRVGPHRDSGTVVVTQPGAAEGPEFTSILTGGAHTCGVTTGGEIRCWGSSWWGQLGIGTIRRMTATVSPLAVSGAALRSVSAGSEHTCGLDAAGLAWCWGDNLFGQRGNGGREPRPAPAPVAGDLRFGSISAGTTLTCALTAAGEPYCWGELTAGVRSGAPRALETTLRFVQLSTGGRHACGLTSAGEAYCWGDNGYGQLGAGPVSGSATPVRVAGGHTFATVDAGSIHTCAIDGAGAAYCWGDGYFGQLGTGASLGGVSLTPVPVAGGHAWAQLSAGGVHTCGITPADVAYCWGQDRRGQLGRGFESYDGVTSDQLIVPEPAPVVGGLAFRTISAGFGDHTCGITTDDRAFCWGRNRAGQLGIGKQEFFAGTLQQMRTVPTEVRAGGD